MSLGHLDFDVTSNGKDAEGPATTPEPLPPELRIFVTTSNMGNAMPKRPGLPKDGEVNEILNSILYGMPKSHEGPRESDYGGRFDLLVIGTQEAIVQEGGMDLLTKDIITVAGSVDHTNRKNRSSLREGGGLKQLDEQAEKILGTDKYETPVYFQRGQMRLIVKIRKEIAHHFSNVETYAENTGLGGVGANKGGIVTTLTVAERTRLTFLSAHLEAHEGKEHFHNRCKNLVEIFGGAKQSGALDASITSHHMWVMGDLNFRVVLPVPEGQDKWDNEEHRSKVRALVEEEDWETLNAADELHRALEEKLCLAGFKTLPCHFHPTFKVERRDGFHYQEKRTPSYCDRILWKSAHGLENAVRPILYEPNPAASHSDHKPMRAMFSLSMDINERKGSKPIKCIPLNSNNRPSGLHLFISDMKCTDMYKAFSWKVHYIMFVTDPKELIRYDRSSKHKILDSLGLGVLLRKNRSKFSSAYHQMRDGWPCTSSCTLNPTDINPEWGDEEVQLTINEENAIDLKGNMLYLKVYDQVGSKRKFDDKLIGTVALNLEVLGKQKQGANMLQEPSSRRSSFASSRRSSFAASRRSSVSSLRNSFQRGTSRRNSVQFLSQSDVSRFDTVNIDQPILKNGKEHGRLNCSITAWWLASPEEAFGKRRSRHGKSKSKKG